MTMQALVIAHAAFGHNHFFKNNNLFQPVDRCRGHPGLSGVRQELHRPLRGALRPRRRRAHARRRARADEPGRLPLSAQAAARPRAKSRGASDERREYERARSYNELWRTVPAEAGVKRTPIAAIEDDRKALLGLPEENILYFLEKNSAASAAVAARDPAHRAHHRPVFLSAAADQGDERGLRHLRPLLHHEPSAIEKGLISEGAMLEFLQQPHQRRLPAGLRRPALSAASIPTRSASRMMQDIERICDRADGGGPRLVPRHRRQRRLARRCAKRGPTTATKASSCSI